jgi:hypothetical protein
VTVQNPIPSDVLELVKEALFIIHNLETKDQRIKASLAQAEAGLCVVIGINTYDPIDEGKVFSRTMSKRDRAMLKAFGIKY